MKRILLIGVLVILLALALPATVSASTPPTNQAIVAGNVKESIELTVTGSIADWSLEVDSANDNEKTVGVDMNVKSTTGWSVGVADMMDESKTPGSAGKMVQYDASAYGTKVLTNALKVKSVGSVIDYVTLIGTKTAIQTGSATPGTDYDIGFKQKIAYTDEKLTTGSYRIIVTFLGSNT